MQTVKNILFTLLLIAAFIWMVTQGNTTDIGKLIRLGLLFVSGYLCIKHTSWGQKLYSYGDSEIVK